MFLIGFKSIAPFKIICFTYFSYKLLPGSLEMMMFIQFLESSWQQGFFLAPELEINCYRALNVK